MKNITLDKCIQFQECFFHDGVFSPFELAEDYKSFYPIALLGEIGGILNYHCKSIRSPHSYEDQLNNECVDMFVYSLLFGRMLEKKGETKDKIFKGTEENWNLGVAPIANDGILGDRVNSLMAQVSVLLSNEKEKHYTNRFFSEMFHKIKQISFYLNRCPWQESVNEFHQTVVEEFTQIGKYTPDLWYNGSCYVDFEKMVGFIKDNEIKIPPKRILFLERMSEMQKK